jgi:hypothetical protein
MISMQNIAGIRMKRPAPKGSRPVQVKVTLVLGCLAICVLPLAEAPAFANPATYPRRVINQQQVDLMPLLIWWDKPQGARPLVSWKHMHGFLERVTMYGWLVRGNIEGEDGLRFFLLKNPPRKEMSRYQELNELLPKLEQQRTSNLEVARLPAYKGWDWDINGSWARLPSDDFDRIEQAHSNVQDLDHRIQAVRAEMAEMLDTRGYFKIDGFALQMSQVYQGSPVFDFGFPPY